MGFLNMSRSETRTISRVLKGGIIDVPLVSLGWLRLLACYSENS
jgi:hypothetical protein